MKFKLVYYYSLLTILFAMACNTSFSQDNKTKQLNDSAFVSLEKNLPNQGEIANEFLEQCLNEDPSYFLVNAHTILGIINKNKGYYVTAINHHLKALNVSREINDTGRISACLNNIGSLYMLQKNYTKGLSYFNKSLNIERKLSNPIQKSIRLFNIGDAYKNLDSLDIALGYFTNSLIIEKKENNLEGITYAQLGITEVYLKAERQNDANNALTKLDSTIVNSSIDEQIIYRRLKAKIEFQNLNLITALSFINKGINLAKSNERESTLPELIQLKIDILESQRDWKQANSEYRKLTELTNRMNNTNIQNQLADLSFQNEINKKELELQLIVEERDIAEKTAKNEKKINRYQSKMTWFLILSILIIPVSIYLNKKMSANK